MAVTFMATLLFSGCQKDSVTLRIRINDFGGNGKVYMDDYNPHWSSSEAFRINGVRYDVSNISNDISLSVPSSPSYSAFYPSQFYSSTDGNAIHFTLPRVQYYETEGNNQLVKAPMAAFATAPSQTASNVPITFNNIGALLAINIDNNLSNNATLTVDSVVVTTVGNTLPLWGNAVLPDITDPNSYYQCVNTPADAKYYTVSVAKENGSSLFTLNNGVSRKVYIFIPSAEALSSNKFKIKVYAGINTLEREQTSATGGLIRHGMMATVPFQMRNVEAPIGAVPGGQFSVWINRKVWFSAGNLQWKPTTNMGTSRSTTGGDRGTWRIAPRQWDFVGYEARSGETTVKWGTVAGSYNNGIEENSYAGWIDMFGWATSGCHVSNSYYPPYQYDIANGYGPSSASSITGNNANYDWGVYNTNAIKYNDNTTSSSWRVLTSDEWLYLLGINSNGINRVVNGGSGLHKCFSPAKYIYGDSTVYGALIYHDDYSAGSLTSAANPICELAAIPAGCVFLPVTSYRTGSQVQPTGTPIRTGYYWSSTSDFTETTAARAKFIIENTGNGAVDYDPRYLGYAVRLVTPVQ